MRKRLEKYKPAAPASVHLLLAAMMWTAVGSGLLLFGGRWVWSADVPYASLLLAVAVMVGLVKGRFVLGLSAERIAERIRVRGDGRCVGGFLSLRTWGLVLVMMTAGRLLRGGPVSRTAVGFVYVAVGIALLWGARRLWCSWYRYIPTA